MKNVAGQAGTSNVNLISAMRGSLGGLPAWVIEYTAIKGQTTVRLRQLVLWEQQKRILVTIAAPADRWDRERAGMDQLLAGIRLPTNLSGLPRPIVESQPILPDRERPIAPTQVAGRTLYTNSWALVIGIDRYRRPGLHLSYAVSDARSVYDLLGRLGFPPENMFLLLNEQATKRRIQEMLGDELRKRTEPDDRLFVFFAGHGVTVDLPGGGQVGYLLPVDADPDQLHATAIPMSDIREVSNLLPAKHIFFAIDACYSGLAAQRSAPTVLQNAIDLQTLVRGRLREILTAGERDQPVIEEAGHGVFTRRLLEGLAGEADYAPRDGVITGWELASWLIPRVQATSGNKQTPFFGKMDGIGDFVFILPREP